MIHLSCPVPASIGVAMALFRPSQYQQGQELYARAYKIQSVRPAQSSPAPGGAAHHQHDCSRPQDHWMTQRSCTTRWALMVISRLASTSLISLTGIAKLVPLARNSRDGFQCQEFALFWQLVTTFDILLTMGNLDAEAQVAVNPEADRPVLDSSRLLFGHPWLAWKGQVQQIPLPDQSSTRPAEHATQQGMCRVTVEPCLQSSCMITRDLLAVHPCVAACIRCHQLRSATLPVRPLKICVSCNVCPKVGSPASRAPCTA